MLGKGENSLYEIEYELTHRFKGLPLIAAVGDVGDRARMEQIFGEYRPQVVFHAAAHKHVPLMEANPGEAVKNNVFGTKTLAEASIAAGVERFVFISTDKAVNPTSIMGATKRLAEDVLSALEAKGRTKFITVRFGNVLGSRGSVVPLFKRQIAAGGPVTVTHPEVERYFMTIPEAVQLVIQAGAMGRGGEIFVLDMGKPVKIVDLARDLIILSGLEPETDISIEFTGLRPGEKLYEELMTAEEGVNATRHSQIFVARARRFQPGQLDKILKRLENASRRGHHRQIVSALKSCLPSYRPSEK
jgi:FlaA1/EpsC-like NDP-sugar epimerase